MTIFMDNKQLNEMLNTIEELTMLHNSLVEIGDYSISKKLVSTRCKAFETATKMFNRDEIIEQDFLTFNQLLEEI